VNHRSYELIVLAGGAARRLGGQDKPGLTVGGRALIANVVGAGRDAGAARVIVVGPPRDDVPDVIFIRDQQQGPVAALACGLAQVRAPWVVLLAADLPFLRARQVSELLAAAADADGAVLTDDTGREQWLASCWRTATLTGALSRYAGSSLHGLLGPLAPRLVTVTAAAGEPPPWLDCDTPADLEHARRLAGQDDVPG